GPFTARNSRTHVRELTSIRRPLCAPQGLARRFMAEQSARQRKTPSLPCKNWEARGFSVAVPVGFEPTVAFTTQLFESCTFGRSDTVPRTILRDCGQSARIERMQHPFA